jgi:serine/threonine protein kinase
VSLVLTSGQRVGPYTVVSPLRAGGMATLYLARRVGPAGFARQVVLKVVHAHLSRDPQFIRMFVDEALLCARIRHPNVVHVEELGEHEGAYYLAMEYVDGVSLEDLLERLCAQGERLPPRLAVSIACSLLEGLYATHTLVGDEGEPLHVVHRDVSPSNSLIDRVGHVKLIDFGVAKARGRAVETSAGTLKGKYAYMSPEQAYGRELDHRSDLYSLCVVLWEMLSMRPLFVADTDLALLERVRRPELPPLSNYVRDLPPALEGVLRRGLAADREARPSTARELRQDLQTAFPEARAVDAAEIGALLERLIGPPGRPQAPMSTQSQLGSTVASTPANLTPRPEGTQPAATRAGSEAKRLRRGLVAVVALSIMVVGLAAGLWAWERARPRSPELPAGTPAVAATPPEPAPSPPAVPSMAAPPHVVEPVAPAAVEPPVAPEAPKSERRRRPRKAAEPAPESQPGDFPAKRAEEPPTPKPDRRARDVHGVPIVEQPSF